MKTSYSENIKIKRKYFEWRAESDAGSAPSTINQIVMSIGFWEEFTTNRDFRQLDVETVRAFKKMLRERINPITGQPLSLISQRNHLIHLKDFYKWLPSQPGYKSKILGTDHRYFSLDRKQNMMALDRPKHRIPTLPIIKQIIMGITIKNEIDQRDQAMIAFAASTAARIDAVISMPLGCIDIASMRILQDPLEGVRTKFGRWIPTKLFEFDEDISNIIIKWVSFLRNVKLFTDDDPLFPVAKIVREAPDHYNFTADQLDRRFWKKTSSAREVFKKRCAEAGVDYFNPHSFRDAVIKIAESRCKTIADYKAVSKNVGHRRMATTFLQYGDLTDDEVADRIRSLAKTTESDADVLREIRDEMKKLSGNRKVDDT
jgi:integrase